MIDEQPTEFGADVAPESESQPTGNIIPFPRMRPNTKLGEAWAAEVARVNKEKQRRYELPSPLARVPSLIKKRTMPSMSWPAAWPDLTRRCKTYVGECIGLSGAIGGGKTSFALQVALANAGDVHPVIWAPLELDAEQVDLRLVGNMNGVGMTAVREVWPEERIVHSLTAVDDMWHYVDQHDDPDAQFQAIEDAIAIAWKIYRVPPLFVVDHLGELVAEERDDRAALRRWSHRFRKLALRTDSYGLLLNQVSKGNQAATTGRVELESASDALGIEMGSQAIASAVVNSMALILFKADDTPILDAHVLVSKARNTGLEGKTGMRFRKAGGVWSELDYLPATPAQNREEAEREKKDKHRVTPPRSISQVRTDLNAARAGDAAAMRRSKIVEAVTRYGLLGIDTTELRKVPGVGRGAAFQQALQELERAGSLERTTGNRWRVIGRIE